LSGATKTFIEETAKQIEVALLQYLSLPTPAVRLREAMQYAVMNGGKRIRPVLMLAVAEVLSAPRDKVLPVACALEMIHSYSLVHDDLPAMDNDDLRRGKPTTHKKFDEATAILAGDTLQCFAYNVLVRGCRGAGVGAEKILDVVLALEAAAGLSGMAGGQMLDLQNEGKKISLTELKNMHALKTGALLQFAVQAPLILFEPGLERSQGLTEYARAVGLAFQIKDDILDVEGSTTSLGKTAGKDSVQEKSTYVSLLGLSGAKEALAKETAAAYSAVASFDRSGILTGLAKFLLERNN
jgi:geranylgeranyl pyrophosphate synthase